MGRRKKWFNAERRKFVTQMLTWTGLATTVLVNVKNLVGGFGAASAPHSHQFEGAGRPSGVVNVEKIPGTGSLHIQSQEVIRVATASSTNTNALPVASESVR